MITIKKIFFLNQIGQRPTLEDTIYPSPGKASAEDRLFLVCDGVGGESFGEEASRIACEGFSQYFALNPPQDDTLSKEEVKDAQHFVLQQMNKYAAAHPDAARMSTTLTLIYIGSSHISAAWCGDSRIYHLRDGKVRWRSGDHSLVANLVRHGELTPEEARRHPNKNVITRSLSASGHASDIDLHYLDDIRENDSLLLCTDGLLERIDEPRLASILLDERQDKEALFLAYAEGLTKDNFSLYLLTLNAPATGKATPRNFWIMFLLILIAGTALLSFLLLRPGHENQRRSPEKSNQQQTYPAEKAGRKSRSLPTPTAPSTTGNEPGLAQGKPSDSTNTKQEHSMPADLNGHGKDTAMSRRKPSENASPLPSASKPSDKNGRH